MLSRASRSSSISRSPRRGTRAWDGTSSRARSPRHPPRVDQHAPFDARANREVVTAEEPAHPPLGRARAHAAGHPHSTEQHDRQKEVDQEAPRTARAGTGWSAPGRPRSRCGRLNTARQLPDGRVAPDRPVLPEGREQGDLYHEHRRGDEHGHRPPPRHRAAEREHVGDPGSRGPGGPSRQGPSAHSPRHEWPSHQNRRERSSRNPHGRRASAALRARFSRSRWRYS